MTSSIATALREYREYIASQNRRALEIYVPFIANAPEPEEGDFDADDFDPAARRMEALGQLVGDAGARVLTQAGVSTPQELLERFDELMRPLNLDGTLLSSIDEAERARRKAEYCSVVRETLEVRANVDVRGIDGWGLPAEFLEVAEEVDGLLGPGLDGHRSMHGLALWWGPREDAERYRARVLMPEALHELRLCDADGWEMQVAAGWDAGKSVTGTACLMLYCRRAGEEKPWAWRYVVRSETGDRVFETMVELLAWHCHHAEPDLGAMPEFEEDDMWTLMF